MNLLIIGGTGTLGRQIVKQALIEGYNVRCLLRNVEKGKFLLNWGAEITYGDLSIPETLPHAFNRIQIVIDAATVRSTDNSTAETTDWLGKIALIEAAKLANIKKFIFFSFLNVSENHRVTLINLKLKVEKRLQESGLRYTIFCCDGFFQNLVNQYAIPILEKKKIWVFGEPYPVAYVDAHEAAKIVIKSLVTFKSNWNIFPIVGSRTWTSREIIKLIERSSGQTAQMLCIPLIVIDSLHKFFRFFEFTWNIADRLQFSEILKRQSNSKEIVEYVLENNAIKYYFSRLIKKVSKNQFFRKKRLYVKENRNRLFKDIVKRRGLYGSRIVTSNSIHDIIRSEIIKLNSRRPLKRNLRKLPGKDQKRREERINWKRPDPRITPMMRYLRPKEKRCGIDNPIRNKQPIISPTYIILRDRFKNSKDKLKVNYIRNLEKNLPDGFRVFSSLTLEQYLFLYFSQLLRKLREVEYQQSRRSKDISFF